MSTSTTFSNGTTLISSALTQLAVNTLMQQLTLATLGINPSTDALAYAKVRIGWVTQPGPAITDDIVSITTTEQDDEYNKNTDRLYATSSSSALLQTDTYVRSWRVTWAFYGPNSFDHARLMKSAMKLDFTHDTLAASALSLITQFNATTRAPEYFQGAWWDRSDVALSFYELVSEQLVIDSIASAEVLLFTERGQVADIHVP